MLRAAEAVHTWPSHRGKMQSFGQLVAAGAGVFSEIQVFEEVQNTLFGWVFLEKKDAHEFMAFMETVR